MVTKGLIVRLEARAGKEDEVAAFLQGALPLVEDEPQTVAWLAVRVSDRRSRSSTSSPTTPAGRCISPARSLQRSAKRQRNCCPSRPKSSRSTCSQRSYRRRHRDADDGRVCRGRTRPGRRTLRDPSHRQRPVAFRGVLPRRRWAKSGQRLLAGVGDARRWALTSFFFFGLRLALQLLIHMCAEKDWQRPARQHQREAVP